MEKVFKTAIKFNKLLKKKIGLGYSANDLTVLTLNLVEQLSGVRKAHKISYYEILVPCWRI